MSQLFSGSLEYIKTPEGLFVFITILLALIAIIVAIYFGQKSTSEKISHRGGRGGNATAIGSNNTAIGGKGGASGSGGKGGDGGNADVAGNDSFAMGGEGGEAGQIDRGGKGGRAPLHALLEDHPEKAKVIFDKFGITEEMAKTIGKGGDGADPSVAELQKRQFDKNEANFRSGKNSSR